MQLTVIFTCSTIGILIIFNSYKIIARNPKIKCPVDHLITVQDNGNLGNNIWEYMSLFAITELHQNHINFLPFCSEKLKSKLAKVFNRLSIASKHEVPKICFKHSENPLLLPLNGSLPLDKLLNNNCPVILEKYSARYYEILKIGFDKIFEKLRFRLKYIEYSKKLFRQLKMKFSYDKANVTFVGMHYRGTDYDGLLKKHYEHLNLTLPTYKYYLKAMSYFKKHYQALIFILITTDLKWLNQNVRFLKRYNNLVVNPNMLDRTKDLVLLSHCNHLIINYGTFGVTAGIFARGTTFVYDLKIPLDHRGPTLAMGISTLLPNWISLS